MICSISSKVQNEVLVGKGTHRFDWKDLVLKIWPIFELLCNINISYTLVYDMKTLELLENIEKYYKKFAIYSSNMHDQGGRTISNHS